MSGYDGRTKGKRIRKLQSGSSNAQARWKYLGADVSDVLASSASPALGKPRTLPRSLSSSAALPTRDEHHAQRRASTRASVDCGGYDIDGDGMIDAREMRMAKFLDAMVARREREPGARPDSELSEAERLGMRQRAGRLLLAKEFIERNQGHLWRYGSIFTGKDEHQGAEFIAEHKNFKKLMAYLENVERQRSIRSSQHFRGCVRPTSDQQDDGDSERQTWVETSRKLRDPLFSKFPLPELQPKKVVPQFYTEDEDDRHPHGRRDNVAINEYGAIDVDGDGVIDDDEMKLHLRLQEATAASVDDNSRYHQQLEGRKMMARDFVARNEGRLWLFDASYKQKSPDAVVDEIAVSTAFSKDFNRLRAKERVLRLKSSAGVSGCLAQLEPPALREDPAHALEFRRVHDRTELLRARCELQKPLALQRGILKGDSDAVAQGSDSRQTFAVRLDARMGRVASESSVGLPRILDAPRRIEPTGSFSVTKWLLDA